MAAYRRLYGLGHVQDGCRGPGSAAERYAPFEHGTTFLDVCASSLAKYIGQLLQRSYPTPAMSE